MGVKDGGNSLDVTQVEVYFFFRRGLQSDYAVTAVLGETVTEWSIGLSRIVWPQFLTPNKLSV